ncbi:MAG: PatA/PatG family cyanobactin maturation protease, partial [Merismopedia sp. SIO2A8]|nr:PatA/PatG family cyanobactin maturation protease [Merismopedia sp. SIO2A8]
HDSAVKGIAPHCQGLLLPIFSEQQPQVSQIDLARAITQAVEAGAHIISISGGQLTDAGEASELLEKAIDYCRTQNVLIVAAAGNDGCDCLHVPASLSAVLAVGALDEQGEPLMSSNWGERYNNKGILAPGENILGAAPGGGLLRLTGTSFAAPIVTGVAALLLSLQHQRGIPFNPHKIRSFLLRSTLPCEPQTTDSSRYCLMGKLNIPGILTILEGGGTMSDSQSSPSPQSVAVNPAGCGCGAIASPHASHQGSEEVDSLHSPPLTAAGSSSMAVVAAETTLPPSDGGIMQAPSAPPPSSPALNHTRPGMPTVAAGTHPATFPSTMAPSTMTPSGVAASVPVTALPATRPLDPSMDTPMTSTAHTAPSGYTTSAVTPNAPTSETKGANLVFALGTLGYDFGTEARRDSFKQLMPEWTPEGSSVTVPANPYDARQMADYLDEHLSEASSLIWTLNLELTPIYAIEPHGSFAREVYAALQDLLAGEVLAEDEPNYVQRISIPGMLTGKTVKLFSGQIVPVIQPSTMRGIYGWKINTLVEEAIAAVEAVQGLGELPEDDQQRLAVRQKIQRALDSLLNRVYYDLRNLGQTSQDRALNFAATNAFQTAAAFAEAVGGGMELDTISVEKSPYCRKDSDCWDVKLKFFDPENKRRARQVFRFTIDVSDLIPVTLGEVRSWRVPS